MLSSYTSSSYSFSGFVVSDDTRVIRFSVNDDSSMTHAWLRSQTSVVRCSMDEMESYGMTVFSSRGQISFSSKRLKRIYFVASFHARTKPWSLIEPIVIRSGFRAEGLAPPFEGIDQNPPVINLRRRSESFRRIYRSWHRWPAVNLRWQEGTKKKKRGKKKKEAANVFFLKLEKGGIKISGRGRQRWANSIIGK